MRRGPAASRYLVTAHRHFPASWLRSLRPFCCILYVALNKHTHSAGYIADLKRVRLEIPSRVPINIYVKHLYLIATKLHQLLYIMEKFLQVIHALKDRNYMRPSRQRHRRLHLQAAGQAEVPDTQGCGPWVAGLAYTRGTPTARLGIVLARLGTSRAAHPVPTTSCHCLTPCLIQGQTIQDGCPSSAHDKLSLSDSMFDTRANYSGWLPIQCPRQAVIV